MKTQFKVGDKVTVTSWYYDDIRLPQNATIIRILAGEEPYQLELEDYHKGKKQWWFREGEFELTNNMSVKGKTFIYKGDREAITNFTKGKEYICQNDKLEGPSFLNDRGKLDGWIYSNHERFTLKEESKKILGYKFKKGFEKYEAVAEAIGIGGWVYGGLIDNFVWTGDLKEAGLLDLWFEPVYEEEKPKYIDYTVVCSLGDSSFSVIVSKDKASFDGIDIPISDLDYIVNTCISTGRSLGPWSIDYSYISIGCKKNISITELVEIVRLSETL